MKKIFGIIAIALLFSFVGNQKIIAQNWDITVTWEDGCDPCDEITGHYYEVCLKIWNTCTDTEVKATECVPVSSGFDEKTFSVSDICIPGLAECFEVSASVKKICVFDDEIICLNDETRTYSCNDIYYGIEFECNIP